MRVLVVDDEPLVRRLIADDLAAEGHDVLEAKDADDAVKSWLSNDPVHLVVTDVRMPGSMDGFGLARWLKAQQPAPKVLVISGFAGQEPRGARAYDAYLGKPFTGRAFKKAVDRVIGEAGGN